MIPHLHPEGYPSEICAPRTPVQVPTPQVVGALPGADQLERPEVVHDQPNVISGHDPRLAWLEQHVLGVKRKAETKDVGVAAYVGKNCIDGNRAAQEMLYQANDIGLVWYIMGTVGLLSAFGMFLYGRWMMRLQASLGK